ncbi:MAG: SlyX family protein [Xanthomonadales bacterium]|nr:SlyX family protein [Xanthomonadales bacterium]
MEHRLIELESRLAFQDDLIENLNEAVIRQQQQIERLELISKTLAERLRGLSDSAGADDGQGHEVPPHY